MQPGELDSVTQTIFDWLTSQKGLVSPVLLVIIGMTWVWSRTGSSHMVTSRIWQLLLGKREFKSSVILGFLDDRDALMHFRLVTGLKMVGTLIAAERLIEWTRRHEVDIDLVCRAGPFFDLHAPGFSRKPPSVLGRFGLTAITSIFFYGAIVVAVLGITTPAVIKVTKSDTWYAVSAEKTYRFQWEGKQSKFSSEQCVARPNIVHTSGYPTYDVDVLCDVLKDPLGRQQLHSALLGQRIALAFSFMVLSVFAMLFFLLARQAASAVRLHEWVVRHRQEEEGVKAASADTAAKLSY